MGDDLTEKDNEVLGSETEEESDQQREGVLKTAAELIELVTKYFKEQASFIAYDSFFGPLEGFKKRFAAGIISSFIFGVAAIFISVGLLLLLTTYVTPWVAYLSIGVILLITGSAVRRKEK